MRDLPAALAAHLDQTSTTTCHAWRLTRADDALIAALADGVAQACGETGLVNPRMIESWRAVRTGAEVEVGHTDIFARPR